MRFECSRRKRGLIFAADLEFFKSILRCKFKLTFHKILIKEHFIFPASRLDMAVAG